MNELREALELVLLYHSGSPWDEAKAKKWERATGRDDATTKALCDHVRYVLSRPPQGEPTGLLAKIEELAKERDELRTVLRDVLEERGVDKYRKRLVDAYDMAEMLRPKHTSTEGDRRTQALQSGAVQAFGHAIAWLDEATAGALR